MGTPGLPFLRSLVSMVAALTRAERSKRLTLRGLEEGSKDDLHRAMRIIKTNKEALVHVKKMFQNLGYWDESFVDDADRQRASPQLQGCPSVRALEGPRADGEEGGDDDAQGEAPQHGSAAQGQHTSTRKASCVQRKNVKPAMLKKWLGRVHPLSLSADNFRAFYTRGTKEVPKGPLMEVLEFAAGIDPQQELPYSVHEEDRLVDFLDDESKKFGCPAATLILRDLNWGVRGWYIPGVSGCELFLVNQYAQIRKTIWVSDAPISMTTVVLDLNFSLFRAVIRTTDHKFGPTLCVRFFPEVESVLKSGSATAGGPFCRSGKTTGVSSDSSTPGAFCESVAGTADEDMTFAAATPPMRTPLRRSPTTTSFDAMACTPDPTSMDTEEISSTSPPSVPRPSARPSAPAKPASSPRPSTSAAKQALSPAPRAIEPPHGDESAQCVGVGLLKQPMDGDARAKTVLSMSKTAIPKAMPHTTATCPITVDLDEDIADDVLNNTTTASDSKSAKEKKRHINRKRARLRWCRPGRAQRKGAANQQLEVWAFDALPSCRAHGTLSTSGAYCTSHCFALGKAPPATLPPVSDKRQY